MKSEFYAALFFALLLSIGFGVRVIQGKAKWEEGQRHLHPSNLIAMTVLIAALWTLVAYLYFNK